WLAGSTSSAPAATPTLHDSRGEGERSVKDIRHAQKHQPDSTIRPRPASRKAFHRTAGSTAAHGQRRLIGASCCQLHEWSQTKYSLRRNRIGHRHRVSSARGLECGYRRRVPMRLTLAADIQRSFSPPNGVNYKNRERLTQSAPP